MSAPKQTDGITAKSAGIEAVYPLSPLQQGLLFHAQLAVGNDPYCVQQCYRITGDLNADVLQEAWRHLVARHAVLRTGFVWKTQREPLQVVKTAEFVPFRKMDWRGLHEAQVKQKLETYLAEDRCRGFDLNRAPLMRLCLIQTGPENHYLVKTYHHIVTDGGSSAIMMREAAQMYQALLAGRRLDWPQPRPYRDYIRWLKKQDTGEADLFWRRHLEGFDAKIKLPSETGATQASPRDDPKAVLKKSLPPEASAALTRFTRQQGVTLNTVVQSAWALLLSRYCTSEDVLFGVTVSGRPADLSGAETMVGLFINTLPLHLRVPPARSFLPWLRDIQSLNLEIRRFGHLPLPQIQALSALPFGQSLFDSLLVFENYARPESESATTEEASLQIERVSLNDVSHYPLTLYVLPGSGLQFKLWYGRGRIGQRLAQRLLNDLILLLAHMAVADPSLPLARISVCSEDDRKFMMAFNLTGKKFDFDVSLPLRIERQAARLASETAVWFQGESLIYGELNVRANRLAHVLKARGLGPEMRVGLCLSRGPALMISVLGVLKSGAAYVPLDPKYPRERLHFMLGDAGLSLLITERPLAAHLGEAPCEVLFMEESAALFAQQPDNNLQPTHVASNLAYMIYTSGSTGMPKAVQVTHRNLTNFLSAMLERLDFLNTGRRQSWLSVTSLSFDISVLELWLPLLAGGRVVLADTDETCDAERLMALLKAQDVSWMQATPATWRLLLDAGWQEAFGLNALCGGEALPADLAQALTARVGTLWNVYGPTETTVWASAGRMKPNTEAIDLGRPLANTRIHVLDTALSPVPLGAVGELYIGGEGVARAYWRRPGLSAERFMPDPFSEQPGARLYRSGDLACFSEEGRLQCLGRVDHQIKLRGHRIELGEIEAALLRFPGVCKAVVSLRQKTASGTGSDTRSEARLVAYWVGDSACEVSVLRAFMKARLPEYMLPVQYVALEELPLTPNGKLDRKALPAPPNAEHKRLHALGAVEQLLASMWRDLLGIDREIVDKEAHFFELGGHSLSAMRLVTRIRKVFDLELPLRTVFSNPCLSDLARQITAVKHDAHPEKPLLNQPIKAVPVAEDYPLSFAQERLWFLYHIDQESDAYHLPLALRIKGDLKRPALKEAFKQLQSRHSILHSRFFLRGGQARTAIDDSARTALRFVDLSCEADPEKALLGRMHDLCHRPFDLEQGPPLRAECLALSNCEHVLVWVLHHIVADGWSIHLLLDSLAGLYQAACEKRLKEFPVPNFQYVDYALWQREIFSDALLEKQLDYWKRQLDGIPSVLTLPTDRPRLSASGLPGARVKFHWPKRLSQALYALSRKADVTLFMTLLSAFQWLLSRYSGQNDVCVGIPVANRERPEFEAMPGTFVNTLVLRGDLSGRPCFMALLKRTRTLTLEAYAHQGMPFERLLNALKPARDVPYTPLFQVAMVLQNTPPVLAFSGSGLRVSTLTSEQTRAKFDLTLHIVEGRETLQGSLEYNADLFAHERITRLLAHYENLLVAVLHAPEVPLAERSLLSNAERSALTQSVVVTHRVDETLVSRFAAQAGLRPDAAAVRYEGRSLSYGALNARANRVAQALIAGGAGPETRVGLCCGRSFELLIGLLGILKAGAAYVPLDPAQPVDRLNWIAEDAGVHWIVGDRQPAMKTAPEDGRDKHWLAVDDVAALSAFSDADPHVHLLPDQLAYILYTSGSTGKPKGVMVTHAQVLRLFAACEEHFSFSEKDVFSLFHATGFDFSVWEIWGAWRYGGSVVLVPEAARRSPEVFADLLIDEGVTVLSQTPSAFTGTSKALIENHRKTALHTIVFGGEALSPEALAPWIAHCGDENPVLVNMYGITETTVHVTYRRIRSGERQSGIGRGLNDLRTYILDIDQHLTPSGVAGELCIGGAGLSRGYANRPGLTAARFIPDPFSKTPGARLYRSGDKVLRYENGEMDYLGRLDTQIQLRGYRIELGEIEAAITRREAITAAVVLLRDDVGEAPVLVAYVVSNSAVPTGDLREYLAQKLPEYMLPGRYVLLDKLPVTANGKLDRAALPAPDAMIAKDKYVSPRNETERRLAEIWCEVLGLKQVGTHDNFFELGGDSLSAIRVMDDIGRELGGELPLTVLFREATIFDLANQLSHRASKMFSRIVTLRSGSMVLPLYCLHPGGGHVLGYHAFAEQCRGEQAILGLQSRSVLDSNWYDESVSVMAKTYAKAIRIRQEAGPYALLGWSMGGVLAMAVAALLEQDGESVSFLALVEPPLRAYGTQAQTEERPSADLVAYYAAALGAQPLDDMMQSLDATERKSLNEMLADLEPEEERLLRVLAFAQAKGFVSSQYTLAAARWRRKSLENAARLLRVHRVETVSADLHLWVSQGSDLGEYVQQHQNAYTRGALICEPIAASHTDIMSDPFLCKRIEADWSALTSNDSDGIPSTQ